MNRVRQAVATSTLWRRVRIAGFVLVGGAFALALVPAGRAVASTAPCGTLSSGTSVYIDCSVPSPSAPYASFHDGDVINLSMGPNSLFSSSPGYPGASIGAIECEYNNGAGGLGDPPNASYCSAQTQPADFPFNTNSDGSFDYVAKNNPGAADAAVVFAIPDTALGDPGITCNDTNPCVWYVGVDYNNFTAPHTFSNPFIVTGSTPPTTTTSSPTTTSSSTPTSSTSTSSTSTTTSSAPTTTMPSGSTTAPTTTAPTGSSTTSTTYQGSASTTTTTAPSTAGSGSSGNSSTGNTGSGSGGTSASSNQLAFTGASPVIVWMLGFGLLFVIIGTAGRLTIAKPAD